MTTDHVTRWDRKRDEELTRRLKEAEEELDRRERRKAKKPPTEPPVVLGWHPDDCL